MKSKKVLNVRIHLGGLHGKTSYDSEQDGADMVLEDGIITLRKLKNEPIIWKNKKVHLNFHSSNVFESITLAEDEQEEPRRGPGRPPRSES